MDRKIKPVMNLGGVKKTRIHDYQRFFIALLLALAFSVVAVWGYTAGYLPRLAMQMGPAFTAAFIALAVAGVVKSLWDVWWLSRGINALKAGSDPREQLERLFHAPELSDTNLQEVVTDNVLFRFELLSFMALVASALGFLGTLIGIADVALNAFIGVEFTVEIIKPRMSMFWAGIQMAIQTSVVGCYIWIVIRAMRLMVVWTALTFETRVKRVFSHGIKS